MTDMLMAKHGKWGNILTTEQIAAKTKNYDKLMGRCFYAVASNLIPSNTESFWEINWWDGEAREGKKVFTNQTVVKAGGKEDVSPVWVGNIVDGVMRCATACARCCVQHAPHLTWFAAVCAAATTSA